MASLPDTNFFDGIICFGGEDWWYHNRGHYDMQMMRRLGRQVPVLYVNSIGMRVPKPSEGRMFFHRIRRKLRSIAHGACTVEPDFTVLSPPVIPSRIGLLATRRLLLRNVRRAAARLGIKRPLLWVACPTAAAFVDALRPVAIVYQRTDRYECLGDVDSRRIIAFDRFLKRRADLTVFCSQHLLGAEQTQCTAAALIDHGVDLERFTAAEDLPEPTDVSHLPRPRIGFVGSIDEHTFDADLMTDVARRVPEAHFVLVGPSSLQRHWTGTPNISMLGQVPLELVPSYLAACDVLMMPWNQSPWIESCNPVKLKEYLAAGRPIVSTDFPEARRYNGFVHWVKGPVDFAHAIRAALTAPCDLALRREYVSSESWDSKADQLLGKLAEHNIEADRAVAAQRERRKSKETATKTCSAEASPPRDNGRTPRAGSSLSPPAILAAIHGRRTSCRPAGDLAACIVLSGGLRPSPLVLASARCTLDLWLTTGRTVLDCWLNRIQELAVEGRTPPPVRIIHDSTLPPPWIDQRLPVGVIVEREPRPYRGAAGVLADVTRRYHQDEHVLVVEGARYATVGFEDVLQRHCETGADVTVAINHDHTLAGIYIIRCGTLDTVPSTGFLDLKEQWLERATDDGAAVQAVPLPGRGVLPLRDRRQFLLSAKAAGEAGIIAGSGSTRAPGGGALPEPPTLDGSLRVICPGAIVGPGAVVMDSVVMPGAVIGARAVIARSVICPHTHVQAGTDIADAVVHAGRCLPDQRPVYA